MQLKHTEQKTQTALVTGAASGLGFELALLLAKDGYGLMWVDVDTEKLETAKREINVLYSSKSQLIYKDLSTCNVAEEISKVIANRQIDVLINNAGFGLFGNFNEAGWERDAEMLNLHVVSTTHLPKLGLKGMVARGSAKIMIMSSPAAFQHAPLMSL